MAKNQDNNYFAMFVAVGEKSVLTAEKLREIMQSFDPATLLDKLHELHAIEQSCDEMKHELLRKLAQEFITPIEREDIMAMANQLDEVIDGIEDVLIQCYMYNVKTIRPDALQFADIIVRCTQQMLVALKEFENFKKSKTLREQIIAVNGTEEEGDRLHIEAVRRLYTEEKDPLVVTGWTRIYNQLERCCDDCEDVANVIEEVVMNNL